MCAMYQGVRRGERGAVVAGGAPICGTVYEPGAGNRGRGRREAVGPLGRVAWTEGEAGCG